MKTLFVGLLLVVSTVAFANEINIDEYFTSGYGSTVSLKGYEGDGHKFIRYSYEVFANNSVRYRENGLEPPELSPLIRTTAESDRNDVFALDGVYLKSYGWFYQRRDGAKGQLWYLPHPIAKRHTFVGDSVSTEFEFVYGVGVNTLTDFQVMMNGGVPSGYTKYAGQKTVCTILSRGSFMAFDDVVSIECKLSSATNPGAYFTYWFARGNGLVGLRFIGSDGSGYIYSAQPLNNNDPIVTPPGPSNNVETGWYWDPATSGRGWFVERQGSKMFVAGYLYGDDGKATWLAMPCDVASDLRSCNGTLDAYQNGQTLTGPYRKPSGSTVGQIKVTLAGNYATALTWPGGTVPLQRFSFDKVGPYGVDKVKTGWYWNADESGQGWSVEVQGGSLFVTGYLYDDAGKAVWYLAAGGMTDPTTFEGTLNEFANGQTLTGPYKQPVVSNHNVGSMKIKFRDSGRADMTIVQGSKVRAIGLTRFNFGG